MYQAISIMKDENFPRLEKGTLVVFDKAISFGTFREKRFVVVDPRRLLFRAGTQEGPEVKILSTFFRIYDFETVIPLSACSLRCAEMQAHGERQLNLF